MPIMQASAVPEKFDKILLAAIFTLTTVYVIFGNLTYFAWGKMKTQMITQELPIHDPIVKVILFLYVLNVIMSYPLAINPTNTAIESNSINKFLKKNQGRYWINNISRSLVVFSSIYLSIEVSSVLDKFIGVIGAIFCAPLAFLIPTMCHLRLVAKTNEEKLQDIIIIVISIATMIFCVAQTL